MKPLIRSSGTGLASTRPSSVAYALAEQDLAGGRLVTEACGEVRHAAERTVVVPRFEADAPERGMAHRNARSEAELVPTLAPTSDELPDALSHRERELRRLKLWLGNGHRVVEEHHEPVTREVLERSAVRHEELAGGRVVLTHDPDELLGLGGLGEGGEPAEIEVDDRDVRPMTGEEPSTFVPRDESRDPGERNRASLPFCRSTVSNSLAFAIALWSAKVAMSSISALSKGRGSLWQTPMTPRISSSEAIGSPSRVRYWPIATPGYV
jgi:hypothetical protein